LVQDTGYIHETVYAQRLAYFIEGYLKSQVTTPDGFTNQDGCGPVVRVNFQERGGINQFRLVSLQQVDPRIQDPLFQGIYRLYGLPLA
jgi:hypothetical protein